MKNRVNFKKRIQILIIFHTFDILCLEQKILRKIYGKKLHNKSIRVPTRRHMLLSYRSHLESSLVHVTALSAQEPFAILSSTSIRFTNIDMTTSPKALINTFMPVILPMKIPAWFVRLSFRSYWPVDNSRIAHGVMKIRLTLAIIPLNAIISNSHFTICDIMRYIFRIHDIYITINIRNFAT